MYADEAAKAYCKSCRKFYNCFLPCTTILVTLWDKLGGKTTVGEIQELIEKARCRIHTDEKK